MIKTARIVKKDGEVYVPELAWAGTAADFKRILKHLHKLARSLEDGQELEIKTIK